MLRTAKRRPDAQCQKRKLSPHATQKEPEKENKWTLTQNSFQESPESNQYGLSKFKIKCSSFIEPYLTLASITKPHRALLSLMEPHRAL